MGRPRTCEHGDEYRNSEGRCRPCRNVSERKRYDPDREANRKSYETVEMRRIKSATWRALNPERDRELKSRWQKEHPESQRRSTRMYRARKANAEGSFTEQEWLAVVASQDGKCAHCGRTKPLDADHILPLSHGGSNFINNIQGLCRPCNSRKCNVLEREPLLKEAV